MDHDIIKATQSWADANGIDSVNVEKVLSNMDMSDFLVFTVAIKQKNYDLIGQLYHRASSHMMESYKFFNGTYLLEDCMDKNIQIIDTMSFKHVYEAYQQIPGSTYNVNHLSIAEMKTLVYEAFGTIKPQGPIAPQNPASQFSGYTTDKQPPAANDGMTPQQKQTQIMQAEPGTVQVQGAQEQPNGSQQPQQMSVQGIDIDEQDPSNTNVVVADPTNPNEVNIMSLDDIKMMESMINRMSKLAGV